MYFHLVGVATFAHSKSAVFTYHSEQKLEPGTLVRVSVGKKEANGVILSATSKPKFTTKPIQEVLYPNNFLPIPLLHLAEWLSDYYAAHYGLVLQSILPSGAHKRRRNSEPQPLAAARERKEITLTDEQSAAVSAITAAKTGAFLLHGVPGSGKTQTYIEVVKQAISEGKSAIILVPEIALTAQLIAEFANYFDTIFITHSGMSEAQRHKTWESILTTEQPCVVIGPRSALFSPVRNVGVIVVDECHEQSFKQDRAPRYQTIHAASQLAKLHRAKIVLGSATPNISELFLADKQIISRISLGQPVNKRNSHVTIVSHKDRQQFSKHRFLSTTLIEAIQKSLAQSEQALLFHNRRGTAPAVLCEECGWQASCPLCDLPLTFHGDRLDLRCHTCNFTAQMSHACPECKSPTIVFKGIGTKLIFDEVTKLFPKARIARFDADNEKGAQLQERYQELYDGEIDILIGTQILAKGLDLPGVTTVGVLQADAGLHLPDFSANERTFQLLYQVAGRAGRTGASGHIIMQTYTPDNPVIQRAAERDFAGFAAHELEQREKTGFPPFSYLLKLTYAAKTEEAAVRATRAMAQKLRQQHPGIKLLGPAPAFRELAFSKYHWQIVVKSKKRPPLQAIAQELAAQNNWQVDLDPATLL